MAHLSAPAARGATGVVSYSMRRSSFSDSFSASRTGWEKLPLKKRPFAVHEMAAPFSSWQAVLAAQHEVPVEQLAHALLGPLQQVDSPLSISARAQGCPAPSLATIAPRPSCGVLTHLAHELAALGIEHLKASLAAVGIGHAVLAAIGRRRLGMDRIAP